MIRWSTGLRGVHVRVEGNGNVGQRLHQAFTNSTAILNDIRPPARVDVWPVEPPVWPFVNRSEILAAITRVAQSDRPGPAVVAIFAPPATGKTQLLRRCADVLRELFDVAVDQDLDNFLVEGQVAVEDALKAALRDLHVDETDIPPDLRGRRRRYLSETEGRRVLVLLDGVSAAAQVTQFIPNSRHAVVIAAGEVSLDELAVDGATVHQLGGLDEGHGIELLAAAVDPERIAAEERDARRLVRLCSGSPLLLKVAARHLRAQPELRITELADDLQARQPDPAIADERHRYWGQVATVFDSAYNRLGGPAEELYCSLGSAPGSHWPVEVVAGMMSSSVVDTRLALAELARSFLVEQQGDGYAMPLTVRRHAAAKEATAVVQVVRDKRRQRAIRTWVSLASAADHAVTQDRFRIMPNRSAQSPRQFTTAEEGMTWFRTWHVSLADVMNQASAQRLDDEVWQLFEAMWPYYNSHSQYLEWIRAGDLAVESAQRCGDVRAEARTRCQRARAFIEQSEFGRADDDLEAALALADRAGDPALLASVHDFVGHLYYHQEDFTQALTSFDKALALSEQINDRRGIALQTQFRGRCLNRSGRYDEALAAFARAADLITPFADHRAESRILSSWAEVLRALGRPDEAATTLNLALDRCRALGNTDLAIVPLERLAELAREAADPGAESQYLQRLLLIVEGRGRPREAQIRARLEELAD
ncbi:MAG: tetratricopeptide repeat protein [Kribbellaceae bacterium]|nr:tetratricopeptide repeat protein [Kribbellaceae bacterium]